jgi:hypothetical protein
MDVEVLSQLSYCSLALDGGKRNPGLECRGMVPAWSSAPGRGDYRRCQAEIPLIARADFRDRL